MALVFRDDKTQGMGMTDKILEKAGRMTYSDFRQALSSGSGRDFNIQSDYEQQK